MIKFTQRKAILAIILVDFWKTLTKEKLMNLNQHFKDSHQISKLAWNLTEYSNLLVPTTQLQMISSNTECLFQLASRMILEKTSQICCKDIWDNILISILKLSHNRQSLRLQTHSSKSSKHSTSSSQIYNRSKWSTKCAIQKPPSLSKISNPNSVL